MVELCLEELGTEWNALPGFASFVSHVALERTAARLEA
jgi:hypothetical protein